MGFVVELTGVEDFDLALTLGFGFAIFTAIAGLFFSASYGKFNDSRFGVEVDPRLGWFLMELPATLVFNWIYWRQNKALEPLRLLLAALFIRHYLNRGFYFPLTIRVAKGNAKKSFSISVIAAGIFFTSLHGYLNARWIGEVCTWLSPKQGHENDAFLKGLDSTNWFNSAPFLLGFVWYELSFWGTVYHERLIRKLRDDSGDSNSKQRHKIPRGGLFEYITNATYLAELSCWFAWALISFSPCGVLVFFVSFANLVPRAFKQHQWYHEKFEDYPNDRKVLLPFII